jgi:DNA topoisomerase-1
MCNLCGRPMVIKKSRFGPFLGCSGYPECSNTRRLGKDGKPVPLPEPTGVACPKCQQGELMRRRGKFGRPFFGCNRYPKCDYLVNDLAEVASYVPGANVPSTPAVGAAPKAAGAKPARPAAAKPAARTGKAKGATTKAAASRSGTKASSTKKASSARPAARRKAS